MRSLLFPLFAVLLLMACGQATTSHQSEPAADGVAEASSPILKDVSNDEFLAAARTCTAQIVEPIVAPEPGSLPPPSRPPTALAPGARDEAYTPPDTPRATKATTWRDSN